MVIHNSCVGHFRLEHARVHKTGLCEGLQASFARVNGRQSYPICSPSAGVFHLGAVYAAYSPSLWSGTPEALSVEENGELKHDQRPKYWSTLEQEKPRRRRCVFFPPQLRSSCGFAKRVRVLDSKELKD
jgi:hypothetical protein